MEHHVVYSLKPFVIDAKSAGAASVPRLVGMSCIFKSKLSVASSSSLLSDRVCEECLSALDWRSRSSLSKYQLSAVLRHEGASAHTGHYTAGTKERAIVSALTRLTLAPTDIRNESTNLWYKFNDDAVEEIQSRFTKGEVDCCIINIGFSGPSFPFQLNE